MDILLSFIPIVIATYIIWKIGTSFDIAASYLTRNLNEGIKGPTINAIASSLPELLIASFFLIFIGNIDGFKSGFATIIGSSIFNIALIPTIAFLVIYLKHGKKLFPTSREIIKQDGIFLIITEIFLIIAIIYGGISTTFSIILITLYLLYIYIVIKLRNKNQEDDKDSNDDDFKLVSDESFLRRLINLDLFGLIYSNKKLNNLNTGTVLILSIVIMAGACHQIVLSSESLSATLGIEIFIVTFIITAIASSVPDTILSIKDAENEKYKDAFSNAYASNIFDICIGIGLPVLVYLLMKGDNNLIIGESDQLLLLSSSVLLLIFTIIITFIYWLKDLNIFRSIIIISCYIVFLILVYIISLNKAYLFSVQEILN